MKGLIKILSGVLLLVLVVFLLLGCSLQVPSVQNFIVQKISRTLSDKLQTKVDIEKVHFDFFNSVQIQNIYAADTNQDTLLAVENFYASIGLFSLLNKTIHIDNINLIGLTSNIYRSHQDSSFNYEYIINAFGDSDSSTKKVKNTPTDSWDISFGKAQLRNINFQFQDSINQIYLTTSLPETIIDVQSLDLSKQIIILENIQLERPQIDFNTVQSKEVSTNQISFPYFAWTINIPQLEINQANIRYWLNDTPTLNNNFDTQHLNLDALNLNIRQFNWDSTEMSLRLDQLAFEDISGLSIQSANCEVLLSNQQIDIHDLDIKTPYSSLKNTTTLSFNEWNDLSNILEKIKIESTFQESKIAVQDIDLFSSYIPSDYQIKGPLKLNGALQFENKNLQFDDLSIELKDVLELDASGQVKNITNPQNIYADIKLNQLNINYKNLRKTLPALALPSNADSLGVIQLYGNVKGDMDTMEISKLYLSSSTNTRLQASGIVNNLLDTDALKFDLMIDTLQSKAEDIAYFLTSPLPLGVYEMQLINYIGNLSGTLTDFQSDGTLYTSIGQLLSDINITFSQQYSNATYDGNLALKDFNLGLFLQDTSTFGLANFNAIVNGSGLSLDNLNTDLEALVESFEFNNYNYKNIEIQGDIEQMKFIGKTSMDDPNLSFDFEGLVNLNETKPTFQFDAQLDTIDLKALQLSDQIFRASAHIKSNFTGNNIDDFLGSAIIQDIHLSNGL